MAYTLCNKCAKNLCKRTVLLQLIIKNVVTCFFLEHCTSLLLKCQDYSAAITQLQAYFTKSISKTDTNHTDHHQSHVHTSFSFSFQTQNPLFKQILPTIAC